MFSLMNVIVGFIAGTIGLSYLIYGKKMGKFIFMITGVLLMGYPYFIENNIVLVIIGVVLLPIPFIFKE
jgi:hypothetical protein